MEQLSRTIAAKVTAAEYEAAQTRASQAGTTVSRWLRSFVRGERVEPNTERSVRLLLAEVLALRSITINLLYHVGNQSALTQDDVSRLIQQADREKLARAETQLANNRSTEK
jgi:hypothetical protein